MGQTVFFRNDDVRGYPDGNLEKINELFIGLETPIIHAVEPGNINKEAVDYLLSEKRKHPHLIEIVQHGFEHRINFDYRKYGRRVRGEFGGTNSYSDDLNKLRQGKEIMDTLFHDQWNPVITFPYGSFNSNTIKAVNELNYIGMSSAIAFGLKSRIKDTIGHSILQNKIFGLNVSYHLSTRPHTKVYEIDTSLNLIKKYINDNLANHYSVQEVLSKYAIVSKNTPVIGILLHHRYHGQYLDSLSEIIISLKSKGVIFSTLKGIVDEKK